jgi:hypothetical protein
VLTRVPLREPAKFDQFGLGRFQSKAELPQPVTEGIFSAERIFAILETDHKVVDIAHQPGFAPQPDLNMDHLREHKKLMLGQAA